MTTTALNYNDLQTTGQKVVITIASGVITACFIGGAVILLGSTSTVAIVLGALCAGMAFLNLCNFLRNFGQVFV